MLFLQGCSEKLETKIIQQAESPDGSLVATVFIKEGDATLPLMVDVYLGAKGDEIPAFGNVFRGNHSEKARVAWVDNKKLEIISDSEPFLLMKEYAGVNFELKSNK
ncbi:hypothetical protein JIN84_08260 [Luteolibacter yonseiensis]|uniref:Uncharacterized protein n=1 Tax=Luteolibacter yonseiensis TaxID=1144680 RepID=A0A934R5G6_9BACT|nr:hypothetical protein [Luteolibacter yonseiensis]MBK1815605.1 hypothetical protein [Luteolibacter yonseiensis]